MQWTHFKKLKINKLVEHIIIVHLSKVWNQIVSRLLFQTEHPVSLTGLTAGPNIFHFTESPTIVQTSEIIEGKAVTGASCFEALQALDFFQSFCIVLLQAPQSQLRAAKFKKNTQVINGTVLRVVVPGACRVRTPLNTGICSLVAVWEIGSAQVSTFFRKSIEHDLGKNPSTGGCEPIVFGLTQLHFSHVLTRQVGKSNREEMVKDSAQHGLKHIPKFIRFSTGHVIDTGDLENLTFSRAQSKSWNDLWPHQRLTQELAPTLLDATEINAVRPFGIPFWWTNWSKTEATSFAKGCNISTLSFRITSNACINNTSS